MTEKINEINSKLIDAILADFQKVSKNLNFASKKIIENKFSNHPIFIMTKKNIKIGSVLIDLDEVNDNKWKYYATYFENAVENKLIIDRDKFLSNYKNSNKFCCLIVLEKKNSKFIFVPYQPDKV